jgi:hypothetical protein
LNRPAYFSTSKNYQMKNPIFQASLFALLILFLTTSCEETVDMPEESIPAEQLSLNEVKSDFLSPLPEEGAVQIRFDIQVADCYAGGQSLEVVIDSPDLYGFLWEVDGSHGGHASSIECACGATARVRVMSLADGESVYRSVELLPCEMDDSF